MGDLAENKTELQRAAIRRHGRVERCKKQSGDERSGDAPKRSAESFKRRGQFCVAQLIARAGVDDHLILEAWMPKFYFHLRGDGQNFDDPDGSDFPSLAHAERAAVRAAALIGTHESDEAQAGSRFSTRAAISR